MALVRLTTSISIRLVKWWIRLVGIALERLNPLLSLCPVSGCRQLWAAILIIATARKRPPKSGQVICCCRLAYPWWLRPMRPALRRCFLPRLLRHLHLCRRRPREPAAFLLDCPVAIPTAMGEATDRIRSPKAPLRPPPRVSQRCWHGEFGQGPLNKAVSQRCPMSRRSGPLGFRLLLLLTPFWVFSLNPKTPTKGAPS